MDSSEASQVQQPRTMTIEDHNGDDVIMAWIPKQKTRTPEDLPPFGFQVYLTDQVQHPATAGDVAVALARAFSFHVDMPERCKHRFDVYSKPQATILDCMSHTHRESSYRNRNGIWPRLVSNWLARTSTGQGGYVIQVDNKLWPFGEFAIAEYHLTTGSNQQSDSVFDRMAEGVVIRTPSWSELRGSLVEAWTDAGHTWTQDDLQRRNDGGFSPALYPAVDPAARADADASDVDMDLAGLDIDHKRTFSLRTSHLPDACASDLAWLQYTDLGGSTVISIWDPARSRTRPKLSETLYLSDPSNTGWSASELFRNLRDASHRAWTSPWCLDVVLKPLSLEVAFRYHAREASRRDPARTTSRQRMLDWLLPKINASRLPTEILEQLEALLSPPLILSCSKRRCLLESCLHAKYHVFLHLGKSNYRGAKPLCVESHNRQLQDHIDLTEVTHDLHDHASQSSRRDVLRLYRLKGDSTTTGIFHP